MAEATGSQAADLASDGGDIVVTANRREERLQDVGISVTAVTGDTLDNYNIRTAEDLGRLVPGLNATSSSGSGVSTIVIRGVGETDFSDHQEQPNASYQDGTYVPFATAVGIPLFDLQRVEALRGPQGTLFGRNATGGLIQYISNKPKAGLSGAFEGAVGDRDLRRVQGFFNGGSDLVAGRLAYFYQSQRGVIKNVRGPDRGNKEVYALRGQLRLEPGENTSIILRAEGFNQYGTSPGYKSTPSYFIGEETFILPVNVDAYGTGPGNDPYGYRNPFEGPVVELDNPGELDKKSRTYAATIEHDLGAATLTSITSYGQVESRYNEDTDSSPIRQFDAGLESEADAFQQDLRINGSSGALRYTGGLFYLDIDSQNSIFNSYYIPNGQTNSNEYRVRTKSKAVYGQIEYDLTDKLTAILGARYTWDDIKLNFRNQCTQLRLSTCRPFGGLNSPVLGTFPGIGPIEIDNDDGDWSGKAQLNFKPTDDVLLYASASKGLKSGGFTVSLARGFPLDRFSYKPENLYAYEIGEKAQFFDNKVTLNSSLYYYDYKNLQSFLFEGVAATVINLPAEAYGGEVELSARPTPTLSANVGLAYNHFLLDDVPFAPGGRKQRPVNAPRLQLIWGLTKSLEFGDDMSLSLSYFGRYRSRIFYNLINTPMVEAPGYSVHDFTARLDVKDRWYVAAYLNNAFDKSYIVGAFDVANFGYLLRSYGERRTFSIAAGVNF